MTPARKPLLRWLLRALIAGAAALLAVAAVNVWMTTRSRDRIYTDAAAAPAAPAALVLGTAEKIGSYTNSHFRVRMDAAAALYHAGKVKHLLLSGDNSRPGYNEPEDMKSALATRGVPAAAMTCDYAGLRTLDSIIRAREVFGLSECIIVSDDFHLARALWIADRQNLKATAFHTVTVPWKRSWNSRSREWLARILAIYDEAVETRPKHGGEKIPLPL
jgi:SanA protein